MTRRDRVYKARNCLERADSGVEWRVTAAGATFCTASEERRVHRASLLSALFRISASSLPLEALSELKPASALPGFAGKAEPLF